MKAVRHADHASLGAHAVREDHQGKNQCSVIGSRQERRWRVGSAQGVTTVSDQLKMTRGVIQRAPQPNVSPQGPSSIHDRELGGEMKWKMAGEREGGESSLKTRGRVILRQRNKNRQRPTPPASNDSMKVETRAQNVRRPIHADRRASTAFHGPTNRLTATASHLELVEVRVDSLHGSTCDAVEGVKRKLREPRSARQQRHNAVVTELYAACEIQGPGKKKDSRRRGDCRSA